MDKLTELRSALNEAIERMNAAVDAAESADADEFDNKMLEARAAKDEVERLETNVKDLEALAQAREAHKPVATRADIKVTREERTYRPDGDHSFFRDLSLARDGDTDARARLQRNNAEAAEVRAISTTATAGGEYAAPVYMNELFEPFARAGRPFADQCVNMGPVPAASVRLPAVTTGATAAVQTDNNAVSNTDQVTASVQADVQTVAGKTVASQQLRDFGTPSLDQVIYLDLLGGYNKALDTALVSGNVANAKGVLNVSGVNAVTYTDATPTVPEFYPSIFQAKSQIEKGAFRSADFILTHPSIWNWYLAALDSSNRPLALDTSSAAFNAAGSFNMNAEGVAGNIAGIPVVIDANMPTNLGAGTNESRVVVVNRSNLLLWENAPTFRIAEETGIGSLQVNYVMHSYYLAMFARQPKAISVIAGTGLIPNASY